MNEGSFRAEIPLLRKGCWHFWGGTMSLIPWAVENYLLFSEWRHIGNITITGTGREKRVLSETGRSVCLFFLLSVFLSVSEHTFLAESNREPVGKQKCGLQSPRHSITEQRMDLDLGKIITYRGSLACNTKKRDTYILYTWRNEHLFHL